MPTPSQDEIRANPRYCGNRGIKSKRTGLLCGAPVIAGTERCRSHAGIPSSLARAEGVVRLEAKKWGLTEPDVDPGDFLLRLVAQSARRVERYARLLAAAYEAAERIQAALRAEELIVERPVADDPDAAPDPALQTAYRDLGRILNTGGVAALVGFQYDATKDGMIYATGEAIRGLAQLELQERKFGADLATKAIAAGIAERQVRLAERQGALMTMLVSRVFDRLGMSDEQRQLLPGVLEAEVISITEGRAA